MVKITMDTLKRIKEALREIPKGENVSEGEIVEAEILRHVFSFVEPKDNWKGPIDHTVLLDTLNVDRDVIARAVMFMTGSEARFEEVTKDGFPGVRVRAAGYYAATGA